MSFFKAYDMRGAFGTDFDLDTVYRVGRWLPVVLKARRFLVGRDVRLTSEAIRDTLCRALMESGASVDDMGLVSTPMVYFFTAEKGYEASVQITASHNPSGHNGMKVSMEGALPVGYDAGLGEVERHVLSGELPPGAGVKGAYKTVSYRGEYIAWLKGWNLDFSGVRFAMDCSNGMASPLAGDLFGNGLILNRELDGSFPSHSPNPLDAASREQLVRTVLENHLDCGMIFDGDADRVMFVDEKGKFVPPDCIIPILARYFLRKEPGVSVIHDIRTSRGAIEALRADGALPHMGKVGHAYAKILLRRVHAVCGGELAGHYYFRDFHFCDSAALAAMLLLSAVREAKERGGSFSELMAPICRYANSGEMNFRVSDKDAAIEAVIQRARTFAPETGRSELDGVRLEFADGWVNVRKSNTEPFLRLIVEATDPALLQLRIRALREVLAPFAVNA